MIYMHRIALFRQHHPQFRESSALNISANLLIASLLPVLRSGDLLNNPQAYIERIEDYIFTPKAQS